MSDDPRPEQDLPPDAERSNIDFESPRWRDDPQVRQGDVEREHRFRDTSSRPERGAIDRDGSVGKRGETDRSDGKPA